MARTPTETNTYIEGLAEKSCQNNHIVPEMYGEHHVYRGLRDLNGNGVVTGLTEISRIEAKKRGPNGEELPCEGQLYYRGVNVRALVNGFLTDDRFGFEETLYLLLFSELPDAAELAQFRELLAEYRRLPTSFVRDMIMKAPGRDMMNILSRSVLALYTYDDNPDDTTVANVLRQCLQLAAVFPPLAVYGYQSYRHFHLDKSLVIHRSDPALSTAENLLYLLREDGQYTHLEAKLLDVCLILHMEHGGGNNSTFTTHLVSSTLTDTYSVIAAALGSLKGPRHGGANLKVIDMFAEMKEHLTDWTDEDQVADYLRALLHKEAFDHKGLIYGMGHAVYSLSDPRAVIFKKYVEQLSEEKGYQKEYALYCLVEKLAPKVIAEERKIYKGVCANVDFFSGFAYQMLNLPRELYTPIFAIARIVGWSAHRLEELCHGDKIMRPAYMTTLPHQEYVPMDER